MKREFGKPLVESMIRRLDLSMIVDTSGAYIPGHGTPTAILIGRHRDPDNAYVHAVLGKRGEPDRPAPGSHGLVWDAIVSNFAHPGHEDDWISVELIDRDVLKSHPWALGGGGASALVGRIETANALKDRVKVIGYSSITGDDEFLVTVPHHAHRLGVSTTPYVIGEEIRDYQYRSNYVSLVPQDEAGEPVDPVPPLRRLLWRGRTVLANRLYFGRRPAERGLRWFDYAIFFKDRSLAEAKISYSNIGTHNHFAIDRAKAVFNAHGQVILPLDARDSPAIVAVLNSSIACFWLKQKSQFKGLGGVNQESRTEHWEGFYEFSGSTIQGMPLPGVLPRKLGSELDRFAQELSRNHLTVLMSESLPTSSLMQTAQRVQTRLLHMLIAYQEELDWQLYHSYGMIDESLTCPGEVPEIGRGERAFEIVLARRQRAGEVDTTWFSRHRSSPITEIPDGWPADYRELVQRRIDAIESVDAIRLLEAPEYKRRWATEPFEKQADRALRGWLLDRLEDRSLWFTPQGQVRPQSVSQLADTLGRDPEFRSVVDLWQGRRDTDLEAALTTLVETEAVPYLAALRLKESGLRKFADWQHTWDLQRREDAGEVSTSSTSSGIPVPPKYGSGDFRKTSYWQARGKLDVPKERFILYPGAGRETDPTPLLGWAGWDHAQQSLALATILHERIAEGAPDTQLVPLVAGLAELQPWVEQWHSELDPTFGVSPAQFAREQLSEHLKSLGLTVDDLAAWRPPAPSRGRRAAK